MLHRAFWCTVSHLTLWWWENRIWIVNIPAWQALGFNKSCRATPFDLAILFNYWSIFTFLLGDCVTSSSGHVQKIAFAGPLDMEWWIHMRMWELTWICSHLYGLMVFWDYLVYFVGFIISIRGKKGVGIFVGAVWATGKRQDRESHCVMWGRSDFGANVVERGRFLCMFHRVFWLCWGLQLVYWVAIYN